MVHKHLIEGYLRGKGADPFFVNGRSGDDYNAYAIGYGAGLIDLNLEALGQPELAGLELLKRRFDLIPKTVIAMTGED